MEWKDITLRQFDEIKQTLEDETLDDLDKKIYILASIYNKDIEEFYSMPLQELSKFNGEIKFLNTPLAKTSLQSEYKIGEWDLILNFDIKHITVGQYMDYQTYLRIEEMKTPKMLSCFLIPKGCKYGEGYDVQKLITDIYDHLPITDASAITAFFLTSYVSLSKAILSSQAKKMKKELKKEKDPLKKQKIEEAIKTIHSLDGLTLFQQSPS